MTTINDVIEYERAHKCVRCRKIEEDIDDLFTCEWCGFNYCQKCFCPDHDITSLCVCPNCTTEMINILFQKMIDDKNKGNLEK